MYYREDGFMSSGHRRNGNLVWLSPKAFLRNKVRMVFTNLKKRCHESGLDCEIDVDYLISIFPLDHVCPATGIVMQWGDNTSRNISPSLDRIDNNLGYTKTNVIWVCAEVNRIKSNKTPNDLRKIADFYDSLSNPAHGLASRSQ